MVAVGIIGSKYDACADRLALSRVRRKQRGLYQVFHDISDVPGEVEGILNAGIRAQSVHGRMSVQGIAETNDVAFRILLCDNLIIVPF